ncbi:unnamed protein product [Schistosoma curassoni]|uniref:Uncharacterized protein n=1 Tax=Schistosoma curassoni TaxID=6186 RepID=A0A183JW52_9TREM|nr:unnamed protein product [Schistosoma curassoni]
MYLYLTVDVHSGTRTQYRSFKTPVSFYLRLVSWMYLYLRVDVHSGTRTQYRSLQ